MDFKGTTILAIKKEGWGVAIGGDGQVTFGQSIAIKHKARKVRRLYKDRVIAGFAGATADAFALFEKFEAKLEEFNGNLLRASVELAKNWRTDKFLRRLEAMLVVADVNNLLILSGTGDVLEPDEGVIGIGSGGAYAQAAALALLRHTSLSPVEIIKEAMSIASDLCVYTNKEITIETITE